MLDSFDEIPEVLDNTNAEWLIRELSKAVAQLLMGGHESRGVVASRFYRSPDLPGDDHVVLEVRPFSDFQIGGAIDLASINPERLKWLLFRERPEWITYALNPFTLSLMVQYVDQYQDLPATRAALFEHAIDKAMTSVAAEMNRADLTKEDVVRASERIAAEMLGSEDGRGLDVPVPLLRDRLTQLPIEKLVDIMEAARIVRISRPDRTLSFVHRRFNEFFLIADFRSHYKEIPLVEIPTDGRLRDALVLYTEVAEPAQAEAIATFCWTHARLLTRADVPMGKGYIAALHALRFLGDAFRGRRECLVSFVNEVNEMIERLVSDVRDLLATKHAVEAAGLLTGTALQKCLIATLEHDVRWLSETAFRSMRYLPRLDWVAKARLLMYLFNVPVHYQLCIYRNEIKHEDNVIKERTN